MTQNQEDKIVYANARKYISNHPEQFDDIIQECRIALEKAKKTHDPQKGAISTHAKWVIRGHMTDWLRKHLKADDMLSERYKSSRAHGAITMDGHEIDLIEAIPCDIQLDLTDYAMVRHVISKAMAVLNPREKDILLRCSNGETLQTVGEHYNLSRERVRQIREQAKEKLIKSRGRELKKAYEEIVNDFTL